jgi:predicted outer membrane repeat protein
MSKSRIFTIFYGIKDNTDVTLKNIIFKNGVSKIYGGAILNFGNLIIDNCTFINNYAHTAGGAINSLGSLNLMNSKFSNNLADGDAGAVFH